MYIKYQTQFWMWGNILKIELINEVDHQLLQRTILMTSLLKCYAVIH